MAKRIRVRERAEPAWRRSVITTRNWDGEISVRYVLLPPKENSQRGKRDAKMSFVKDETGN